jgi:hypothetical protein
MAKRVASVSLMNRPINIAARPLILSSILDLRSPETRALPIKIPAPVTRQAWDGLLFGVAQKKGAENGAP